MSKPLTFDRLQTISREPFDTQTISVCVGYAPDGRMRTTIRDEMADNKLTVTFDPTATEEFAIDAMQKIGHAMQLTKAPSRHET